ncbi:golgin subfamily A member 4-like isoform X1 [Maniola hyperantus]|uniref:golgin subfamily A member 4-like isoform X1 n=1 Tax=Aphantopus hyperantus TaxID=2795564 RepID=UPI0037483635
MFKKFKDKLAEEVKSSPQRIQQFAQAAQAAVSSASSSISDITNNDLFSIGDNDASSKTRISNNQPNNLQEVSLVHPENVPAKVEPMDYQMTQESQRQRRLSNSSLASDISFRLPSYESLSMYHLQSDMEVSASEAEDRGFPGGTVNLDRVTKEQLYSAYRRTQDRCTKYKTQYADLARHYKLLERENAKAKNVLVETQDKALRRISELREQCSLEQSAKAHLEKALQIDIEEKNMKIETLNTKLSLLQSTTTTASNNLLENNKNALSEGNERDLPLITLATDNVSVEKLANEDSLPCEITVLNNKVEKMEQLINKYKDSLKTTKEKNALLTAELQKISIELDIKVKENDQLQATSTSLLEARKTIEELNENIEELQNKNNSNEFVKSKEMSNLELNLKNAQEEVLQLHKKIEVLSKREEEYAISLAENKLSIHKELEGKENEIKSLKESLNNSQNEMHSRSIIINDYKNKINHLEEENSKLRNDIEELNTDKTKIIEVKTELETFAQKCQRLESLINKSDEEYKCLELQMKQENAEKLAMVDRNVYLENRNTQLLEENSKKNSQISHVEQELQSLKNYIESFENQEHEDPKEINKYMEELNEWKVKCSNLESEIQDERIELVKLQSEIEKLLANHELVQNCNKTLNITVNELQSEIGVLKDKVHDAKRLQLSCEDLKLKIHTLRNTITVASEESKTFKQLINTSINTVKDKIIVLSETAKQDFASIIETSENLEKRNKALQNEVQKISEQCNMIKNELIQKENENEALSLKIKQLEADSTIYSKEIQSTKEQQKITQSEINKLMSESEKLNVKMRLCNEEKLIISERNDYLIKENAELHTIEKSIMVEKEMLKEELNKVSNMYKDKLNHLEVLSKENDELLKLKDANMKKNSQINDLEKRLEEFKEENISLKNLSDSISKNVIDIEFELKEVQKSHTQIEMEKDHLIKVIDNLEKDSAAGKQLNDTTTQTDLVGSNINDELVESNQTIKALQEEMKLLKEVNTTLSTQNEHNQSTINETDEILRQRNVAFDTLKEDNRRLQSDIEGLQTHISKVSKENSQLNDKLREIIASTENIPEKVDILSHDLETLKNEIQSGKDKIESLIRENSFLAEENLELKDQLQSQTYSQPTTTGPIDSSHNVDTIMAEYNTLLDTKNKLENKLSDLELMNQSINGNMQLMQANNDKLKLSNEKLGLRLDEALVSLRHLHALQENTELEYLKNILYEYLTGTGTHSITLAKVLAAVVKFDDRQTELVLQKEKERQGFLRQLGII